VTGSAELLAELLAADEAYASTLEELDALLHEVAALRGRAEELAALLAAAPAERDRLASNLEAAEGDVVHKAEAFREAEDELRAAQARNDGEREAAARRFQVRARDALTMAEKRLATDRADLVAHDRRIEAAKRETADVEARAAAVAGSLLGRAGLPEEARRAPDPGLDGVGRWASAARAALLVARSSAAGERDAVIRQANELASAALGEPLAAASTAAVARQFERTRRSSV
jgi:hypothetical protein